MVATLRPLPPGAGSWTTRLMAAPLARRHPLQRPVGGAVQPRGAAQPAAVRADRGRRRLLRAGCRAPRLNGLIRADNLTYDNETYGTRLSQMRLAGALHQRPARAHQLDAQAGDGTVQAQGIVGLAADSGFPIDLRATLDNARLAKSDALGGDRDGHDPPDQRPRTAG